MGRKVTLKDIADRVGVSTATVSYVLNGKEQYISREIKERIFTAVKEMGYYTNMNAKSLVSKRSRLIGIVVPQTEGRETQLFANNFYSEIVSIVEYIARDNGYQIIITGMDLNDNYIRIAHERGLDGIIAIGVYQNEFFDQLGNTDIPIVIIDSYCRSGKYLNIRIDDEEGSYIAAKHLIDKGHRNIGFLCGHIQQNGVMQKRYIGYQRALTEAGIDLNDRYVFEGTVNYHSGLELSERVAKELPRLTGVVCSADILAIGLMKGLSARKIRVPEDISLIGFDDLEICRYLSPGLTTIRQQIASKGRIAMEKLLEAIEKRISSPDEEEKFEDVVLPVELIERDSVREVK
ncbi:MAG: LacI family transcriptional regulator [Lachnospiraceae bacterium]|nr:LacI family transcriptional regulator [Lachnospiraceae bacterium]